MQGEMGISASIQDAPWGCRATGPPQAQPCVLRQDREGVRESRTQATDMAAVRHAIIPLSTPGGKHALERAALLKISSPINNYK